MQYLKNDSHKLCAADQVSLFSHICIYQIVSQKLLWKLYTLMNCTLSLAVFLCFSGHISLNLKVVLLYSLFWFFVCEQNWVNILSSLITCGSSLWVNVIASFTTLHLFISSPLHKPLQLHLTWYSLVSGFMAAPALVAQCSGLKATSALLPTQGWSFT